MFYIYTGLVAKSCPTLATPWTVAHQAPLSMGFSRKEYWSGLSFSSPGDLPNPGFKPGSPALQAESLPTELLTTDCYSQKSLKATNTILSKEVSSFFFFLQCLSIVPLFAPLLSLDSWHYLAQ